MLLTLNDRSAHENADEDFWYHHTSFHHLINLHLHEYGTKIVLTFYIQLPQMCSQLFAFQHGQVETDETESGNGKLERKAETEMVVTTRWALERDCTITTTPHNGVLENCTMASNMFGKVYWATHYAVPPGRLGDEARSLASISEVVRVLKHAAIYHAHWGVAYKLQRCIAIVKRAWVRG